MKILYIANGNGLNPAIGGSLGRSIEIASRLKKMGHEIYFLTTLGGYKACRTMSLDVHYYLLPASIFKRKETGLFDRAFAYIISTLSAFWIVPRLPKYDLVYSDSDYFCDVIPAVVYKKIKKAKWVAMTHHKIEVSKKKTRDFIISYLSSQLQLFSYFLFKKFADGIFVYKSHMGQAIVNYLVSKGVSPSKVYKVTNGVDLRFIQQVAVEEKIYDACFVGGLRPSKGIYDIVPIWKRVLEKRKDAVLVVVGGGLKEYENEIKSHIQKDGLNSQIKMVGAKSHEETIKIMKQSRVFISPSHEEGWGTAICEALACGLPVIAYDLFVYKGIFDNLIITVPLTNIQLFADAILHSFSKENLLKMKIEEKREVIASQYSWDKIADREAELFKEIYETKI